MVLAQCRHEEALHVRMGDRHRPAIRDLGLEVRHHSFDCAQDMATAASENIAKAHRDERTPALLRGILHDPFDRPFAKTCPEPAKEHSGLRLRAGISPASPALPQVHRDDAAIRTRLRCVRLEVRACQYSAARTLLPVRTQTGKRVPPTKNRVSKPSMIGSERGSPAPACAVSADRQAGRRASSAPAPGRSGR